MKTGTLVQVDQRTATGTRTVIGRVTDVQDFGGDVCVWVTGTVIAERLNGLPLPIETQKHVNLEFVPVELVKAL